MGRGEGNPTGWISQGFQACIARITDFIIIN
jgi:hypothetical protein